jgi:hypothetical protein
MKKSIIQLADRTNWYILLKFIGRRVEGKHPSALFQLVIDHDEHLPIIKNNKNTNITSVSNGEYRRSLYDVIISQLRLHVYLHSTLYDKFIYK